MISHGLRWCPLGWSKWHMTGKTLTIIFHLMEIWHMLLEVKVCQIHYIISGISNSRIRRVILIDDNTTLLDYKYQFIWTLYVVDNRSWTWVLSCCYLHRVLKCNWFSITGYWINFRIGFWGSQYSYKS